MQQNPKFIENRRVLLPGKQHQKKRFTNKNLDCSGNNKKKRVVESSNLHEIKPIEITAPIKVVEKPKEETTVKIVRTLLGFVKFLLENFNFYNLYTQSLI